MIQQQEDRPQDPNHMNVIEINSSDDEFSDPYGLDELDDFDEESGSQGGRSQYFQDANVAAFNAQRKSTYFF